MKIRRSLGWSYSQKFGLTFIQITSMAVIARLLMPEEVGVFVLASSIHFILLGLREMGLGSFLVKEHNLTDQKIRAVSGLTMILAIVLCIVVFLTRDPISAYLKAPGVSDILVFVAIAALVSALGHPASALLRRNMRFDLIHHATLLSKLISVVTTILLAWYGLSYMALAWGLLVEAVLLSAFLVYYEPTHLKLGPALKGWREPLKFGGWMTGSNFAGSAEKEALKIIAGIAFGPAATAVYYRSEQIPDMMQQGLLAPLRAVLLPAFSEDLRDGKSLGPKIKKFLLTTSAVIWPAYLASALLAKEIVLVLLGKTWIDVAVYLPWLLLSSGILTIFPQPMHILVAYGRVRRLFGLRIAFASFSIGICLLAALYSLEAFVISRVFVASIYAIMTWFAIRQFLDTNLASILLIHAKSAACGVVTCLPIMISLYLSPEELSVEVLVGCLAIAPLLWIMMIYLLKNPIWDEMRNLVSKMTRA